MAHSLVVRMVQGVLAVTAACGIAGATGLGWGTGHAPGPGMFPGIASVALLILTLVGMTRPVGIASRITPIESVAGDAKDEATNVRRLTAYVVGLLVAAFTFGFFGYPLSAALALLIMLVAGERVRVWRAVLITVLAVAATWAVFSLLLDVPLPMMPPLLRGLS